MQRTTIIIEEDSTPSQRGNMLFLGIARRGPGVCRVTISQDRYEQRAKRPSLVPAEGVEVQRA
jgi:hypothetical protein